MIESNFAQVKILGCRFTHFFITVVYEDYLDILANLDLHIHELRPISIQPCQIHIKKEHSHLMCKFLLAHLSRRLTR